MTKGTAPRWARETFAGLIRQDCTAPWEESGSSNLSLFDRFEEAGAGRGLAVTQQRRPDHAELLGLLGG